MEKYGFVYLWFDKKHKRYYVGAHWGTENDGYICSSPWMKQAYNHRPHDFKRRIIERVYTNRKETFIAEEKYLDLIKQNEFGKKYYNLKNIKGHWSTDENKRLSINEKISLSHKNDPNWGAWSKGKTVSEETKQLLREANRKQFENIEQREMRKEKSKELWKNPEYRKKTTGSHKGKKHSKETIKKIKNSKIENGTFGKGPPKGTEPVNKGKKASLETIEKLKKSWIKRKEKYPTISEETRKKFINIVTAYDLIENCFVKIEKETFINNKDRYCGTTSKRIPKG
jgi:hypothetical protein